MILVTGSVRALPDTFDEVLRLSRAHVARSRGEAGCQSHAVHIDSEDPARLVFLEQWSDMAALKAHFVTPESRAFARALAELAAEAPELHVYEATEVVS